MREVSTVRLYLLRAMYLLMGAGLAILIWPLMLDSPAGVEHMRGVVWSLLTGISLVALLGIRYPLRMLPLLFLELVWKLVWLAAIGLPLWAAGQLDAGTRQSLFDCLLGVVLVPIVIPWSHVLAHYVKAPGDRWRTRAPGDRGALVPGQLGSS
jgi:hypothetical protein